MNLGLIPLMASIAALGLLVVAAVVAGFMMLSASTRAAGRWILRRAGFAVLTALIFAWAGLFLGALVMDLVNDRIGVLLVWACGPAGLLIGFLWAPPEKSAAARPESIDNSDSNIGS